MPMALQARAEYGPTTKQDALWKIAQKVNHDKDISIEQMLWALYKMNPQAFYQESMDTLKIGQVLTIPEKSDILLLSEATRTESHQLNTIDDLNHSDMSERVDIQSLEKELAKLEWQLSMMLKDAKMKEMSVSKEKPQESLPSIVENENSNEAKLVRVSDISVRDKKQERMNFFYILVSFIATMLGGWRLFKHRIGTLETNTVKEKQLPKNRKINGFGLEHKNEDLSELFFTEEGKEAWYEGLENMDLSELFYTPEGDTAWYLKDSINVEGRQEKAPKQHFIEQQPSIAENALFVLDDAEVINIAHQQDFELGIVHYEEKEGNLIENDELNRLNQYAFNEIGPFISLVLARNCALFVKQPSIVPSLSAQECTELHRELVYRVLREPKQMILHFHRIYFCLHHALSEQLYAALVDLLLILDGKGKHLRRRLVLESAKGLSKQQLGVLLNYLKQEDDLQLLGNQYSIFTKGLLSTKALISFSNESKVEYDVLNLARDYMEYGQLEQALEVLENAILEIPDRFDIQNELLELYVVTKNKLAYIKMTSQLTECQLNISIEWQNSAIYFAGLNNE